MKTPDDFNNLLRSWSVYYQMVRIPYEGMSFTDCMELVRRIGCMLCPGFVIDAENRFVYENLLRWVNGDPSAQCLTPDGSTAKANLFKGIYLAGPTGTGKTLCLNVLNLYAKTVGVEYQVCRVQKQLGWAPQRADAICEKYAQSGDLGGFKSEDMLCIHDLCSEAPDTLYMGNRRNVMQTVLEARGDATNKITLVTSNHSIGKLAEVYGDRVQSRAYEMFNYYELKGNDRRK